MSRLHYENHSDDSSGTITKNFQVKDGNVPTPPANNSNTGATGQYLTKIAKLVPAEIIAGYLAMFGFVPMISTETSAKSIAGWVIFGICLILTPVYLNSQAEDGKPKVMHLAVSTVAFVIWAYVTTGKELFIGTDLYNAAVGSIIMIGFSMVSGMIKYQK